MKIRKERKANQTKYKNIKWRKTKMTKGKPKRDGSGRGVRANRGRGGCLPTRAKGRGRNRDD